MSQSHAEELEHQGSCCFHSRQAASPQPRGDGHDREAPRIRTMPHHYDPDLQTGVLVLCPGTREAGTWVPAPWLKLSQKNRVPPGLHLMRKGQQLPKYDLCLSFLSRFHKSMTGWPNLTHTWNLCSKTSGGCGFSSSPPAGQVDTLEILGNKSVVSLRARWLVETDLDFQSQLKSTELR